MGWLAAAAGLGAGVGGSLFSSKKSRDEAKKNRKFQERMSNTAYQRAAQDLEAAGLNRILALGSPASTPGGSMGTVPDMGASAVAGARAASEIVTQKSQRKLMGAQGDQAVASAQQAREQSAYLQEHTRTEKANADIRENLAKAIDTSKDGWQQLADKLLSPDNVGKLAEGATNTAKQFEDQINKEMKRIESMINFLIETSPATQLWEGGKSVAEKIEDWQRGR